MIKFITNRYGQLFLVFIITFIGTYIIIPTKEKTQTITVNDQTKIQKITELEQQISSLQTQLKNVKIKERIIKVVQTDGTITETTDRESEENLQSILAIETTYKENEKVLTEEIKKRDEKIIEIQNRKYNNIFITYDTDNAVTGSYQYGILRNLTMGVQVRYDINQKHPSVGAGLGMVF